MASKRRPTQKGGNRVRYVSPVSSRDTRKGHYTGYHVNSRMGTTTTPPSINENKYKNAILYFVSHCNNEHLGRVKLNKLLYYLDFISFRDRKKPVTGDKYLRYEFGPLPSQALAMLGSMNNREIETEETPHKSSVKYSFTALVEPDLSVFDNYEKELLASLCEKFELWPTKKIEGQTHAEAPWFYAEPLQELDYNYASDIDVIPEVRRGD